MRHLRQLGIVVLLLASYLSPAMACMVADVPMNAEERACCQAMRTHCEQMGMPASHGCCQKVPKSTLDSALIRKATTSQPVAITSTWLAAAEKFRPSFIAMGWFAQPDYSPPQSPPGSIPVLRI